MEYTKNLKLSKPSYSDDVDVQVLNNNMDILDNKIGDLPYLPLSGGTMKGNINFANKWQGLTYGNYSKIDFGPSGWQGKDRETVSFYGEIFKLYCKPSSTVMLIDSDNIYHKGRKVLFDGGTSITSYRGYTKSSNGLIMQWGFVTNDDDEDGNVQHVTLSTPMPNANYVVFLTRSNQTSSVRPDYSSAENTTTFNCTTTGFDVVCERSDQGKVTYFLVIGG